MAKLTAVVEKLEDVPESFRDVYTEKNGKFYLDAEGIEYAEDVAGLKSALAKIKESDRKKAERLQEFEKQIADDKAALEEAELAKKGLTDIKKKWNADEVAPRDEKIAQQAAQIHELTFGVQMERLIASPEVVHPKAARKLFSDYFALNDEGILAPKDDPTGDPGKFMLTVLKKEYPNEFKGTQAAGGGAAGSQGAGTAGQGGKPVSKWTSEERAAYINANGPEALQALFDSQIKASMTRAA